MKPILISVFIILSFFTLIEAKAQNTATYQPGTALRIDFQGNHSIVTRTANVSNYTASSKLRIDFQGSHRIVDHSSVSSQAYAPTPALRIDFEGKHLKPKN